MPITFVDIERQKSWRIGLFFAVLIVLYFLVTIAFVQGIYLFFPGEQWFSCFRFTAAETLVILLFAIAVAAFHFYFSSREAVSSVIRTLGAVPPDPDDAVHRRLVNVMEEINVASGRTPAMRVYVVPSLSMNALAVSGWKNEAVIIITEGLLSRLTRSQLESVLAHEAYHILSGDCLEATIAASLFGMYAAFLEKLNALVEGEPEMGVRFIPSTVLLYLLLQLSQLLNLFISREREYRADAASLRITRNPIAMAEVLYMLAKNWNGTGIISSGFEMLCIVHPLKNALDETEGWFSNLFSTHPPIDRRISLLLGFAKMDIAEFSANQEFKTKEGGQEAAKVFYARNGNNAWQGPFAPEDLASLAWVTPRTWISDMARSSVGRVSEYDEINGLLRKRHFPVLPGMPGRSCPECHQPLEKISYEKTTVYSCRSCGGVLVDDDRLPRIIVRREVECTKRIESLARAVVEDNFRASLVRKRRKKEATHKGLRCSGCGRTMFRAFYSPAYLIEIDCCRPCGFTWFDRDELEMLQCLIEKKITPRIAPDGTVY